MRLNSTSFVHQQIRKLCFQLELLSGMKLVTDLSDEFYEIRFTFKLGYIVIDYRKNACFVISHRLTKEEVATIDDIMTYCNWLELGDNLIENLRRERYEK